MAAAASPSPKVGTRASIEGASATELTSVSDLQAEVRRLRLEVERLSAQLMGAELASPPALVRRGSTLPDGSRVEIEPDELASMRRMFDAFDFDSSTTINATELKALFAKLGDTLDDDAAAAVVARLGRTIEGEISFDEFVHFWHTYHEDMYRTDDADADAAERRRRRVGERFKLMNRLVDRPETSRISVESVGVHPSLDYRVKFMFTDDEGNKKQISPWHDISLKNPDGTFNFICEIPKYTRAKFEICTSEPFNPIRQDSKNGVLRDYVWGDMCFNYGAFPQTWEDPDHITPETGAGGDNDPIDAIEIGSRQWSTGSVVRVKVLGVIALVDSGETDWKVVVLNVDDPYAEVLHELEDAERVLPGTIESLTHWLRMYKSHKGIINEFGFEGKCQPRAYAEHVIMETHEFWKRLIDARGPKAILD